MNRADLLVHELPDPEAASRFLQQLSEQQPSQAAKLLKNDALLSDVLTLASISPLLATTILQNPEYIWWLNRKRVDSVVRNKEELLESLARFSLTNSQIEPQILLARFRRRELLRIFLRDIRRLATIAEITEEISNLADAILENALRLARQELDNRYGAPLEVDEKGKKRPAAFCIVSLGKLGSKELNYASDIDLLFIYSDEGSTSGSGTRGVITNREYFVKLAETIIRLVGQQTGEGAAYRVDLRLRPHGRVGALALSVKDTIRYYTTEAADWERQVLIRSRASAGDISIFKQFISKVRTAVFSKDETVENALRSVRNSKQKIDLELRRDQGYNVKLGRGGIREIEFISQALQLAYGGRDKWLRAPHTLISLSRLADRKLIGEHELTQLFDAYEFLRQLEHILQMENGLQTHTVPLEPEKRSSIAKRMIFKRPADFESELTHHTENVSTIFRRVFDEKHDENEIGMPEDLLDGHDGKDTHEVNERVRASLKDSPFNKGELQKLIDTSPRFVELISSDRDLLANVRDISDAGEDTNYSAILMNAVTGKEDFRIKIGVLRKVWSRLLLEIIIADVLEKLPLKEVKRRQTLLAESSITAAFLITTNELGHRFSRKIDALPLAVLGLGKLGGAGIDYDSDLDLVMVLDDNTPLPAGVDITPAEFYSHAVEIFVTALSSITREGSLYRVDLRLRPHGKNGPTAISRTAFVEYMVTEAAIWELLAYVKIRGVGGDIDLARSVEREIRDTIHNRAASLETDDIAAETHRVRLRLEKEKTGRRGEREIDIKFGSGGMLDIYFAMRFLQLARNIPDDTADRSSDFMLRKLHASGALSTEDFESFHDGYEFLSTLDHNLRLTVGRSTRLPLANQTALRTIAKRMKLRSIDNLLETLTLHRLNIRKTFDNITELHPP